MMRVLVADDEAPARGKLQRWLSEQADIEVVAESEDGLRAAEAIERLKPDVVFLDIQMPGLSGLEVAAQLEQETAPLIVFVTAFDEHAIKAFELNAIDYLLKPYDKDRLLKTLARIRGRPADGSVRRCNSSTARRSSGSRPAIIMFTSTRPRGATCSGARCTICSNSWETSSSRGFTSRRR
jgi:DNA-binding LytR/AlgR family response regulator